ncbi:lytic transglycosylase domain-containing protein [Bacteroides sp.]|uniref:lytic transglycosylase domain-containing protein n=1 Tax=Bacteroides sp. TaxID=29523 RepID=UPI001B6D512F|nr:lytic transglycosylase domain-containing protein [Bacteroides sp.]MBP6064861.1 lytic transglycosylase domain-containing protein [Bacteroides sp.]MBP6067714.1 lytic transglycosylase domain-containing protein [Bacteroides sp.]MBP6935676.1 lytic transglycosylase domain-containing protein [Bacteroides sp.]MBP8621530.1 lytic transglycosylase domain-containing protein [Bacteroides sp.]MBP9507305.1 lytic transglycosylase domain-containing protein [Bacteroides sp.]
MRRQINYFVSIALALSIGAIAPILLAHSSADEKHSVKSEVPYCVTSPTVPEEAAFCETTIDLRRYDRRERMDRELMAFTYMHSSTLLMLKRANRYFPIIEPILKENNIPDDFKYLMVIESSLNPLAKSPSGAAGLWQIMPATGRELGLEVNENVDERYHVEKSTRAACKYLQQAYAKYGDWMSVSAAYNAGQGRISGQLDKQLADHAMDLWLVEETSRYMFRLLAVKELFSSPQRFGFILKQEQLYPPIAYIEQSVSISIENLSEYAQQQGITYAQLRDANSWLREPTLKNKTGKTYVLHIPTQAGMNYDPQKTIAYDKRWVIN